MATAPRTESATRRSAYRKLVPVLGKILPASIIRGTAEGSGQAGRIHPLIEGIYKPAASNYAFSIASMLKSPYADKTFHNPDGSWWMWYAPKDGTLDIAANASLVRCMQDHEPVLALKQISDKTSRDGARHRLFGLGFIETFDPAKPAFRIRGLTSDELETYLGTTLDSDVLESAIRMKPLEEWEPFVREERGIYKVSVQKREEAFRRVVLDAYDSTCAATEMKFASGQTVEADAAHIISRGKGGSDDPRNGVALCKSVHWAFDQGIFTISDQYEVLIHPKAKDADTKNFALIEKDRSRILLPKDAAFYPHQDALAWHRKECFGRFAR